MRELEASEVLLFGSRARGKLHRGSDCDVTVVSERFAGLPFHARWLAVFDRWRGPVSVDPVGLTVDEFEQGKASKGIVAMALADGAVSLL